MLKALWHCNLDPLKSRNKILSRKWKDLMSFLCVRNNIFPRKCFQSRGRNFIFTS